MTQRDEGRFTRVRLVSVSSDHAKQVIGEHETVTLSSQDWKAFLTALVEADKRARDWKPRLIATVNAA